MPRPNDGGPAFPETFDVATNSGTPMRECVHGMTLRDYYKAMALRGTDWRFALEHTDAPYATLAAIADQCGMMADAMLAEGEKGE